MSMERRALIAFVLSMAVFFAYDALYVRPRLKKARVRQEQLNQQARSAHRADSLAAAARGDTLPRTVVSRTVVPAVKPGPSSTPAPREPLAAVDEKTIHIRTSLWDASFSTRGGEMVSMHLLRYSTRGRAVELFHPVDDPSAEDVFAVELDGDSVRTKLHDVMFEAYRDGAGQPLTDGRTITLDDGDATTLVFRAPGGLERSYRLVDGAYDIKALVSFDPAAVAGAHDVTWSFGPGMQATERNVRDDHNNFRASVLLGEEMHQKKMRSFRGSGAPVDTYSGTLNWVSLQTKYFTAAAIPPQPARSTVELIRTKESHQMSARFMIPAAKEGNRNVSRLVVYIGPLDVSALSAHGVGLERTVPMGMKAIRPISSAVLWSMKALYRFIPNYGWVVIIISVLTKVAFFRLTHKSFKSMKQMQDLQPRIESIKKKYKGDQQKIGQETMKMYKEAGVNPLGGCLPMLLQMPVFFALYNVFKYTIELRGAPWFGWIHDLSQQDVLFHLPFSIPVIGNGFSVLPLVMGLAMFAQSKLGGSPTGGASAATPPGFQTAMPILFTFMFYRMPAGLVLYWIVNTGLSVVQQWYIHSEGKRNAAPA